MINRNNIIPFIQHLYSLKNNTIAPPDLLQKWAALSDADIPVQLQNLFTHWQFSAQQQTSITTAFVKNQTQQKPKLSASSKSNFKKLIGLAIIIPAIYVLYQLYNFNSLTPLYAITNNVSIRNDSNAIIARLDLQTPTKQDVPSFSTLLAADNTVYERSMDSTGNLKNYRKVRLSNGDFTDFLLHKNDSTGYVNQNYVTDNEQEFTQYKTLFGQLHAADANVLDLKFRKIIIGCLGFDENLSGKYLMSACNNANAKTRNKFTSIIKQEIITNNRYVIIARLSDGFYYRFYGDLVENSFAKPKRIGYTQNPTTDDEFLHGDLLFNYIPAKKQYCIYDCAGKNSNFYSINDNNNRVWYFEQQLPQPEPSNNILLDLIDTIKNNLPQLDINL